MNIAVIGSGAREHAIAWHLAKYHDPSKVYIFSPNDFLPNSVKFDISNFALVDSFCKKLNIALMIVGPEEYLAQGIADYFADSNIKVFAPCKAAAKLESSKVWAKNFMKKYQVSTADFTSCDNIVQARDYLHKLDKQQFVIKYDGLAYGKGVFVCDNLAAGEKALDILSQKYGNNIKILIENRLFGEELSLIGICGKDSSGNPAFKLLATARDYKPAYDGDLGPNTGGMGVICPHPLWCKSLEKEIYENIVTPTLNGLGNEKLDFYGFLYFGIIITENGSKLLEYNARFGDPEAEAMLAAIDQDISIDIIAALEHKLTSESCILRKQAFIDVALVSKGYPGTCETGKLITGLEKLNNETLVFYSAAVQENGKKYTNGGRVLHLVAGGDTIEEARDKVYQECNKIHFSNIYYRQDIGKIAISKPQKKRIAIMISGTGTNMLALINSINSGILQGLYEIAIIISNNPDSKGLETAKSLGLPVKCIDKKKYNKATATEILLDVLGSYKLDYIILAGYDRILLPAVIKKYRNRIINIHPADTKLYQGLHGYEWAMEQKMDSTKITVHWVDEGCDTGDIIEQKEVDLRGLNNLEDIKKTGLAVEHKFYSKVLKDLAMS